jgi:hypothetical protein
MCTLNWNSDLAKMPFCTFFKETQESSLYTYAFDRCNNFEWENLYYVMHMIGDSQKIKARKAYVPSTKIRHSGLANQNILFLSTSRKTGTFDL